MEYTIHLGEDTLKQLDEIVNGGGESGGESGGGGSSDFSTAKVTLINDAGGDSVQGYKFALITISTELTVKDFTVSPENPLVVDVPLYKGKCICPLVIDDVAESVMPSVTGGVTLDLENEKIIITGDGSFTAKGASIQ